MQLEFNAKVTDLTLNLTQYTNKIAELEAKIEQLNLIITEKENTNLELTNAKKQIEQQYEELSLKLNSYSQETLDFKSGAEKKKLEGLLGNVGPC